MPKHRTDDAKATKTTESKDRHQQFDPSEKFPVDPEEVRPKRSQKQPGQDRGNSREDSNDGE